MSAQLADAFCFHDFHDNTEKKYEKLYAAFKL